MTAKAPNEPPENAKRPPAPAAPPPAMRRGDGVRVPLPCHGLNAEDAAHNEALRERRERKCETSMLGPVLAALALVVAVMVMMRGHW